MSNWTYAHSTHSTQVLLQFVVRLDPFSSNVKHKNRTRMIILQDK